jgi:hypothetical protein
LILIRLGENHQYKLVDIYTIPFVPKGALYSYDGEPELEANYYKGNLIVYYLYQFQDNSTAEYRLQSEMNIIIDKKGEIADTNAISGDFTTGVVFNSISDIENYIKTQYHVDAQDLKKVS